jgi:hypothetical protein
VEEWRSGTIRMERVCDHNSCLDRQGRVTKWTGWKSGGVEEQEREHHRNGWWCLGEITAEGWSSIGRQGEWMSGGVDGVDEWMSGGMEEWRSG